MDLIRRSLAAMAAWAALSTPLAAQPLADDGPYDPAIPTVASLRGFATGAAFSSHGDVQRVLEGLAAASDRVRLETYGTTPEGRALRLAWVSSPENLDRLDSLAAAHRAFLDPGGAAPDLPTDHPIFVWLSFGAHGDEAGSTEAALELLHHLAAARDPDTAGWLDRAVVVIDPLLNPDGRERYVEWYRSAAGAVPDPRPDAAEHRPPWPGGRTNHWYFDLNRDWAWGVQPETRARRAVYLRTLPQVHVDFHEMDPEGTYFFFPAAEPVHALYPASTERWGRVFGDANAAAFDRRGWAWYSGEDYDLFYPGYGDSWPSYYGATGMTYEQAGGGRAGLALERPGRSRLTLVARAEHHRVAALATIETAVRHRSERLADFAAFWRAPGRAAPGAPAAWLLPGDDPAARDLARLLTEQGIEVDTLAAAVSVAGLTPFLHVAGAPDSLGAGTLVVRSDQPLGRYVAALMSASPLGPSSAPFQDITGWSLPYLFDVPAWTAAGPLDAPTGRLGRTAPVEPWSRPDGGPTDVDPPPDVAAFAWPYGSLEDAGAAARLASAGWRVGVAGRGFDHRGVDFPGTTFVVEVAGQPGSPGADPVAIARAVEDAGARPVALTADRAGEGIGPLSGQPHAVRAPRIALAAGPAASPTSLGAARHLFESRLGLPVAVVEAGALAAAPDRYSAIVLPDGPGAAAWSAALGSDGARSLARWVEAGGTLVGVRSGAAWLSTAGAGLAGLDLVAPPKGNPGAPIEIPGTILAMDVDPASPLGWGYDDRMAAVLVRDPVEFGPSEKGGAWIYRDEDPLAGYLPDAARRRLPGTPWAIAVERGRGRLVLFADDPGFRGIAPGLHKAYLNAVLLAGVGPPAPE